MTRSDAPIAPAASAEVLRNFRRALLRWYKRNRRDLPWRRTHDPYRIWLSEIMLQQTRVAAVLEHYRLFLERFPTIRALAAASEEAVLAAWSGLGYYRRARSLHQCAQKIVREYDGRFPRSSAALRDLPGIGRYTAAAIASIAFAEPVAVVDGNVERVLERLAGDDLQSREVWSRAQLLLSKTRPGDFNQAIMELGATVCTPRQPKCAECPLWKGCVARGEIARASAAIAPMERRANSRGPAGVAPSPPYRQKKKEIWCAWEQRDAHIRLVQRPKRASVMPGMWELPRLPRASAAMPLPAPWRTFRHSITVTDYTVHVIRNVLPGLRGKWIALEDVPGMPITGLTRKILKAGGII